MKNILAILIIACCLAACGHGGGSSKSSTPSAAALSGPTIINVNVSPVNLRFSGGTVQVDCTVLDNRGVASVDVEAAGPAGTQLFSMSATGDDYNAGVILAANESIYEEAAVYTLIIKATDTDNNKYNSSSFTVTVQAMKRPPDPPAVIP